GRWMWGGEARFGVVLPEEHQVLDVPLLSGSTTFTRSLSVEPKGRLLAVSNNEQLVIFDLATGRAIASRKTAGGHVAFTSDGRWLLAAATSGLDRFPVRWKETDSAIDIAIGPGRRLASTSRGYLSASRDSNTIAVVDRFDRPKIVVHNVPDESTRTLRPHHTGARWLSISPDGRLLATGAWHGRDVKIWNVKTGELQTTLPASNARVCFGPAGNELVVDEGSHFTVWRVSDWKQLLPRTVKSTAAVPGPIAFSPDGRWLALRDSPRQVRLLDAATFDELASFKLTSEEFIDSLIFDPQSSRLIVGTTNSRAIHIWNLNRIREKLREIQLDWTDVPLVDRSASESKPLSVQFDPGGLGPAVTPSALRWQQEVQESTRAIQDRPDDADAYWRRASASIQLRWDYEQAVSDCTRALELKPGLQPAWFWRGRAYQQQDDCACAIADFEKSLEIKPDDGWCCRHLAWLYATGPDEFRDPERALTLARKALQLMPKQAAPYTPTFLTTLGAACYRNGRIEEALDALDRSVQSTPAAPSAATLLLQAMCQQQSGRPAEARRCYDRALDAHEAQADDASDQFSSLQQEAAALLDIE
ncbi:MAG TPA: WD40 repeat domain-containing protein, partial [Planctomycetaceae bacterium]|nr:WD40 repeat domain-containing protein [Planctomycetaceae bacterium]